MNRQPDRSAEMRPDEERRSVRQCFLVLGMHRSGTSSVAGVLAKVGITPPKTPQEADKDNSSGYWEPVPLVALHEELLASAGSNWHDWRAFNDSWYETPVAREFAARGKELLGQEFDRAGAFVFKDPRICRFARFWLDVFDDEGIAPKILIPLRSPLEVAQSHRTRDRFSIRKGLLLWLRHALDAEASSRNLPRIIFEWDDFLGDWRSVLSRAERDLDAYLPALTDITGVAVDRFLTGDLKHERVSETDLLGHPQLHDWVSEAYTALRELARNPGSNSARNTLDDLRNRFDAACRLFGGVLAENEIANSELIASLDEERRARGVAEAERDRSTQEIGAQRLALEAAAEAERQARIALDAQHREALSALEEAEALRRAALEAALVDERQARAAAEAAQVAAQLAEAQHRTGYETALGDERQARASMETSRDDALQALRAELERGALAERVLEREQEALAAARRTLEATGEEMEVLRGASFDLARRVDVLQSERAEVEIARSNTQAELENALEEGRRQSETLDRVLSSKSWRLMAPARSVLGWLRRGRH